MYSLASTVVFLVVYVWLLKGVPWYFIYFTYKQSTFAAFCQIKWHGVNCLASVFCLGKVDTVSSRIFLTLCPLLKDNGASQAMAACPHTRQNVVFSMWISIKLDILGYSLLKQVSLYFQAIIWSVQTPCNVLQLPFFVPPEPKMEAGRGSIVKTACAMLTAIL